jgi:hypothetical protein
VKITTKEEYGMALQLIAGAYQTLAMLPLAAMREAQSRADSMGAILDPTLYRQKAEALHDDMKVVEAAIAFVGAVNASMERHAKEPRN